MIADFDRQLATASTMANAPDRLHPEFAKWAVAQPLPGPEPRNEERKPMPTIMQARYGEDRGSCVKRLG